MLTSTRPWWTAAARSIPIGCCALRHSSAHRRAVPGPGQRQSHSGRRPQCGVPVAAGQAADRPVRYITLADNASTTKLKRKQLCASCVINMVGEQYSKWCLAHPNSWENVLMEIKCAMPVKAVESSCPMFVLLPWFFVSARSIWSCWTVKLIIYFHMTQVLNIGT